MAADAQAARQEYGIRGYRWYVLGVLTLIYTCHSMDRGLPNILIEPVRHEFGLSDAQLGLFSGLAYAMAFSVSILPLGYLSDRTNRRNFLAAILLLWSLCTALGGVARNYFQLVLARIGVGASESGAAPIALPMISDIFPAERRGSAIGLFYMSNAAGTLIASVVGGYLAAEHGWRTAFFVAGVPGIVLAILLLTTVKEPQRGGEEAHPGDVDVRPPRIIDAFQFLAGAPGLVCLILACALLGMVGITVAAWLGSFLIRIHGLSLAQVGLVLGVVGGVCSLISPPLYGWLSDVLKRRDVRLPLLLVAAGAMVATLAGLLMLFTSSLVVTIVAMSIFDLAKKGYPPPCTEVLIAHTPVRLRGSVMSILQLTTNIVGFGLGPLFVGLISDAMGGEDAIRYAIAIAIGGLLLSALLLLAAIRLLYGRFDWNVRRVASAAN